MSQMKKLFDQFEEEIEGVEEYTKCSLAAKDDPAMAKMYSEMAQQELAHAKKIREQILDKGSKVMETGEAERVLESIWQDRQDDMTEKIARASGYLGLLKQ